jgi:hypothetical protein
LLHLLLLQIGSITFSPKPTVTYSTALTIAFDPFINPPQKPRIPFVKIEQPFAYARSAYFQHLFYVELSIASVRDPKPVGALLFPPCFHWVPEHCLKDLSYSTNILKEVKSAHFKPIFDKMDTTKLLYHIVYFDTIISLKRIGVITLPNQEEQFQTFFS